VRALTWIAVAAGDVSTTVAHAARGLYAEVGVSQCPVLGQHGRAAPDVEAILSRADGDIALQTAMAIFASDQERVLAAGPNEVSTDEVVAAADGRGIDCEVDARPARADDDIAGDQVAVSLLDGDAAHVFEGSVSGDHVSAAGANEDAGIVSSASVAEPRCGPRPSGLRGCSARTRCP